jgi:segregation and condensation protein A
VTNSRPGTFVVHTATFEGPLDQLLRLAQQGQVDFETLPLADIAAAYVAHARRAFDVDDVTEAVWMLSALMELKARALLPQPPAAEPVEEEQRDLEELLEERLGAYRAFKDVASALRALEAYQQRVFLRPGQEPVEPLLSGVVLTDLFNAFQEVLARGRERGAEVPPEGITVAERMAAVLGLLVAHPDGVPFDTLFPAAATRLEIVVTFLALLELIRLLRVRVVQEGRFGVIRIFARTPEESRSAAEGG